MSRHTSSKNWPETQRAIAGRNKLLRQKVDSLVKKVFGASSEKLDPNQQDLFIVQPEPSPGKTEASCEIDAIKAGKGSSRSRRCLFFLTARVPDTPQAWAKAQSVQVRVAA